MNQINGYHRKSVVVIDSDRLIAKAISLYLEQKGYRVEIFHNPADACDHLCENAPDAIIVDLNRLDGDSRFIVCLTDRNRLTGYIPVIVMSVLEADRNTMDQIKPFAFIQKPFDMGHLLKTIESGLDHVKALASV